MLTARKSKLLPILILALVVILSTFLTGCSGDNASAQVKVDMHPLGQLPKHIQESPVKVREAYQFAVANPELVEAVPCYCGCAPAGHESNYACYVSDVSPSGEIAYDNHALGCSICVDITQDVMRMTRDGEDIKDIRTFIDDTYSMFGPSNMPPAE